MKEKVSFSHVGTAMRMPPSTGMVPGTARPGSRAGEMGGGRFIKMFECFLIKFYLFYPFTLQVPRTLPVDD